MPIKLVVCLWLGAARTRLTATHHSGASSSDPRFPSPQWQYLAVRRERWGAGGIRFAFNDGKGTWENRGGPQVLWSCAAEGAAAGRPGGLPRVGGLARARLPASCEEACEEACEHKGLPLCHKGRPARRLGSARLDAAKKGNKRMDRRGPDAPIQPSA